MTGENKWLFVNWWRFPFCELLGHAPHKWGRYLDFHLGMMWHSTCRCGKEMVYWLEGVAWNCDEMPAGTE